MIGFFQFSPGFAGNFFQKLLLWRYGYLKETPKADTAWNEYYGMDLSLDYGNFRRLQWEDQYGERWYDPRTNMGYPYEQERVQKYLRSNKKIQQHIQLGGDAYILHHGLYPNLSNLFKTVYPNEQLAVFTISTLDQNVSDFYYVVDATKSEFKKNYGQNKPNSESKTLGVDINPIQKNIKIGMNTAQRKRWMKQHSLEHQHCDYYLDVEQIMKGNKEPWQMIDEFYKKSSVVSHDKVQRCCRLYHQRNVSLVREIDVNIEGKEKD